jgi:hypothetical protein
MKTMHILIVIICFATTTNAQYKKLSIQKKEKEKYAYTLTNSITLQTQDGRLHKGRIDYITEDSLFLNIFDKVAIKDIQAIEPVFVSSIKFRRMDFPQWLIATMVTTLALTITTTMNPFGVLDIPEIFIDRNVQSENLTRKERRLQRKRWLMNEYKLEVIR